MKLLIVSYWYAPVGSPRSFRWTSLAEYWAARGVEVDVVAAWSPHLAREEELRGVRVYRPGFHIRSTVRNWLGRLEDSTPGQEPTSLQRAGVAPERRTAGIARWIYGQTWKRFYWPDDASLWGFPALRQARQLMSRRRYNAVISVSLPFTSHLVGAGLRRRFPSVPWIMDVGDPFCFLEHTPTNNQALYGRLNHWVERRLFSGADAAAVTTPATRDVYAKLFPESADKIHVIPPILPSLEEVVDPRPVFEDDGRIRLVFAGNLYRTIREPDYLLRLFSALRKSPLGDRVELHFLGSVRDCWSSFEPYRELIDRSLFLHGTLARAHALRVMLESAVLVNIGNTTFYQLPSKVVEYASLRKPVLNLVRGASDSSARFFADYPSALTLVMAPGEVPGDAVVRRVEAFLTNPPFPDPVATAALLQPYTLSAAAAEYERLIRAPPGSAHAGSVGFAAHA